LSKTRRLRERLPAGSALASGLVIAVLVGISGFNFSRLVEMRQEFQKDALYVVLWPVTQAQYQVARLADRLAPPEPDVSADAQKTLAARQLDVAVSSLSQLLEGHFRQVLANYGYLDKVRGHYTNFARLAAEDLGRPGREAESRIRDYARVAGADLRDLANRIVLESNAYVKDLRTRYLQMLIETAVAFLCLLLASVFFTVNFLRSVNENKRTRQRLIEQEELADLVINNVTSQGIVIFDQNLTCLLFNPGMETLLGLRAADVTGTDIRERVPLFRKPSLDIMLQAAIGGTHSVIEDEGLSPTGQDRLLEIHSYPLRTAGRRLGIAFVLDMSQHWKARRQAERQNVDLENQVKQRTVALQQAERRLIAAIETAPEGFAAFDAGGHGRGLPDALVGEQKVPAGGEQLTLSDFVDRLIPMGSTDLPLAQVDSPFAGIATDLQLTGDTWAHLSVTRADGGTIFMRLTDITQHKRASNALVSALDRERETTGAYRNFVSMVSHQFRTPLAILDSSAQRLLRQTGAVTPQDLSLRIRRMRGAISRLTHLVDSVLNAARLDEGQIEVQPAICNLVDLVEEHCERQRELTPHASIALRADAPNVQAYCDGLLIEQVIVNLLSNAVKYSGEHPRIDVRVWSDGSRAYCCVADRGVGIPADEVPRIFDRFYRARTAVGIAGTGIGLNFAQKIMQLHGGTIDVRSDVALGSAFTFDLPVRQADLDTKAA